MTMHPTPPRKIFCAPGRDETYRDTFRGLIRDEAAEISAVDFTHEFGKLVFAEQAAVGRFWQEVRRA